MAEFILFCIPTVIYLTVQSRGENGSFRSAMTRAGVSWGSASAYGWATCLLVPLAVTGWLAIALVPPEVLELPGVSIAQLTSIGAAVGVMLRAVGEEVFFRGLLGGVLIRRLGFGWGNLVQTLIFLVPHLALLLIDARLWPLVPVQFAAGWLLGWLRYQTGSFAPGAAAHTITNVAAGFLAA